MRLTKNDDVIQALAADRPDQPFGKAMNQRNRMITHNLGQAVVRWLATPPVGNRRCTAIPVSLQQSMGLPRREAH